MVEVGGSQVRCQDQHEADKVLVVLPTTMYFTQYAHITLDRIVKRVGERLYRACYSFHSSQAEVKDLLSYLQPEAVFPNVKPITDASLAEVSKNSLIAIHVCMLISQCLF